MNWERAIERWARMRGLCGPEWTRVYAPDTLRRGILTRRWSVTATRGANEGWIVGVYIDGHGYALKSKLFGSKQEVGQFVTELHDLIAARNRRMA